jgi:hypothetical protein
MAEVPGFGSGFNADTFRTNIKNTMRMGSPQSVPERVTFRWRTKKNYAGKTDKKGKPFDLAAAATIPADAKADIQIDCAVEIEDRNPAGTPLGQFNTPKATITVLDEDYALIDGAHEVLIGENTYTINYTEPVGLFSVTVYTIHATARDES